VALRGDLEGGTFYSMSLATAAKLAGVMGDGEAGAEGQLDGRALAELARVVAATAAARLLQQQCECQADEPALIRGFGEPLTDLSPVLIVPLFTAFGDIDIGVALQPAQPDREPALAAPNWTETGNS
jgi:CheY-specific phosphatase CheX